MASLRRYYDPLQVASDEKDVIISQLKADIFELSRNERDFRALNAELHDLERKLDIQQSEKVANENDYRAKLDFNDSKVFKMKQDAERLKGFLADNKITGEELGAELDVVRNSSTDKAEDLRLTNQELNQSMNQNETLKMERRNHESEIAVLQDENARNQNEIERLNAKLEGLNLDCSRQSRVLQDLEHQRGSAVNEIDDNKLRLSQTEDRLNNKRLENKDTNGQLRDFQNQISKLETTIHNARRDLDRAHADGSQYERNMKSEQNRNYELERAIRDMEQELNSRRDYIDDLKRELGNVRADLDEKQSSCSRTNREIDEYQAKIQKLNDINADLHVEVDGYLAKEDEMRHYFNIKARGSSSPSRLSPTRQDRLGSPSRFTGSPYRSSGSPYRS